ncbi:hypothetical protein HID58_025145 [Brassica napus]|uniref:Uncharacterized protein n=1 Tax=Brassica napus TaxID=3708 RepID=A0ABQ8CM61_BRANA|nr:hypothetical protein HID58_025145 [Brassica napus]
MGNTLFLPILYSELFRMSNGLDLVLGSSSIGTRVHSRRRVGNEACESIDSSESSLDLTAEIEQLRNATVGEVLPSPGGDRFSLVCLLSVIGVEEVANWIMRFRHPDEVTIQIPGPFDRVSDFELGEIPVYAVISHSDYPSGRDMVEQLLELPLEHRKVSFLVSDEALDRCSVRGVMSGSRGDEALAKYKKALEAMSARKAAAKRTAPVEDEEVQFVGSTRRQATTVTAPSSSKKKSKVSGSALKSSPPVSDNWSKVLANLNAKVFPLTPACLASDGDSSMVIRSLQVDALTAQQREEKDAVLAKESEIKDLKLEAQNQEEALERVAAENASLLKQLEDKEEDICELRYAAEVFDNEKAMAVNGAKVVAHWELMREWLHRHTDSW